MERFRRGKLWHRLQPRLDRATIGLGFAKYLEICRRIILLLTISLTFESLSTAYRVSDNNS